jgi:5S rRNA maturation endonuclease (ribonuclease M5)
MSLINEYRATEEAIKELQDRLKNLSQDDKLKKELEFEGKLRALMGEYQKSLRDIIAMLDPDTKGSKITRATKTTGPKRARKVKQCWRFLWLLS